MLKARRDGKTHNLPEDRREDLVQLQRQDERRELRRPSIQRLDEVGRLASGLPVFVIALVWELNVEAGRGGEYHHSAGADGIKQQEGRTLLQPGGTAFPETLTTPARARTG